MEANTVSDTKQFVVFRLGQEEYGVDIQKVTTIEQVKHITRVPKTPDFIKGVINLRGDIIPIMDLRKRFNLPTVEDTEETRIIIIKLEDIFIGIIVDSVAEVLQLTEDSIENITHFSNDLSLDYLLGVGKVDDRIVTLLNIEKLVKFED
ncbi:MAG: chemotaxis protein CheW [Clostridia bacterium]|nr:chemotaxis protein CheW [Clostridia bacterium]